MHFKKDWLKARAYLHIGRKYGSKADQSFLRDYITNPKKVAKHPFCPLIYKEIKERRYKKGSDDNRNHLILNDKGDLERAVKVRPLHYATHLDAGK